jgi:hypothetical protein
MRGRVCLLSLSKLTNLNISLSKLGIVTLVMETYHRLKAVHLLESQISYLANRLESKMATSWNSDVTNCFRRSTIELLVKINDCVLHCCVLFVLPINTNARVTVKWRNIYFILLTTCFG